jgi:Antibiotic biosynthesis monooxygenase
MFLVLWEFEVKPGCEQRFERVYGPGGDWDSLFRRDPDHERTALFRNTVKPRVYLTADYWKSRKSYEEFLHSQGADYKSLDATAEQLTANERHVGSYESFAPESGAGPQ